MAVVAIAFDGTRISGAESETDGGTWDKWGATQSPVQEGDFVYQGTYSLSNKISLATGGIDFDATTAINYSSTRRWVLAKVLITTYGTISITQAKGCAYQIGSGPSAYYDYYIFGQFLDYPRRGGWIILAIDPNEPAYRDATVGSPDLTAIDYYGWWLDIDGSAKAENIAHDALEYVPLGGGLTLTGGTSTDPEGTFQDFIDEDEGDSTKRWGIVYTSEGAIIVTGVLSIGSATATEFLDTGRVLLFTDGRMGAGWSGLKIDLSNASTTVSIADCFFESKGRGFEKAFFNTTTGINGTTDVVTLTNDPGLQDFDYVVYSKEGGSATTGLTNTSSYWIRYDVTNSGWAFYSSLSNAQTDTSRIALTSGGGENHSLTKTPDTRSDLTVSGTSSTVGATLDGCIFSNFRNLTLTSKTTLDSCKMTGCEELTQASATLSGCTISGATTEDGEAFVIANDLDLITDCTFIFSNGHAIELAPTGAGPFTFTLDGNVFTNYGSNGTNDAAIYVNPATSSANITVNVQNGSTPTYRLASGYTGTFSMQQTVTVKVTTKSAVDASLISGARILLEAAPGGDLPAEDAVTLDGNSSTDTLTVSHTGHGMSNGDSVVIRGAATGVYNGVFTISNVSTDSYDIALTDCPDTNDSGEVSFVILDGTTSSGYLQDTGFVYTNDQPTVGIARKGTSAPYYRTALIAGTIKGTGLDVTTFMVSDD